MAQSRIVLDNHDRPKAEAICEATGIKNFSQLFAIFLHNYGEHLIGALKAAPTAPPPAVTIPPQREQQQLPKIQPPSAQSQPFKPMSF
jgi:hypothetical protein